MGMAVSTVNKRDSHRHLFLVSALLGAFITTVMLAHRCRKARGLAARTICVGFDALGSNCVWLMKPPFSTAEWEAAALEVGCSDRHGETHTHSGGEPHTHTGSEIAQKLETPTGLCLFILLAIRVWQAR